MYPFFIEPTPAMSSLPLMGRLVEEITIFAMSTLPLSKYVGSLSTYYPYPQPECDKDNRSTNVLC
ncbi:hypothetical protein M6B38_192425 [Iris pallida]|uniref:Uncharacterized protein n=1 Tax=Iris pallida TaxID=29817 RepID=A0AAX6EER2_IRIPA|nr:hypothetical protein M6B38_192425 [Iris pallida]